MSEPVFPWNDLIDGTEGGRTAALAGHALFDVLVQIRDELRSIRENLANRSSGTVPGEE